MSRCGCRAGARCWPRICCRCGRGRVGRPEGGAEGVWVAALEGGHQDHDAANALAACVRHRLPAWEFAAYNFAGGKVRANRFTAPRGGEVALEATAAEAQVKRRALECYRSERDNLGHIGVAQENARPLPTHDYPASPHPGRL